MAKAPHPLAAEHSAGQPRHPESRIGESLGDVAAKEKSKAKCKEPDCQGQYPLACLYGIRPHRNASKSSVCGYVHRNT